MFHRSSNTGLLAALTASVLIAGVAASSAGAYGGEYDGAYAGYEVQPWYDQPPLRGTGAGYYYRHHPDHVPGYPERLRGYPVPIYSTAHPIRHAVRYRSASDAHIDWCYERWLSYDAGDNTYQPLHGQRKQCRSPYW